MQDSISEMQGVSSGGSEAKHVRNFHQASMFASNFEPVRVRVLVFIPTSQFIKCSFYVHHIPLYQLSGGGPLTDVDIAGRLPEGLDDIGGEPEGASRVVLAV